MALPNRLFSGDPSYIPREIVATGATVNWKEIHVAEKVRKTPVDASGNAVGYDADGVTKPWGKAIEMADRTGCGIGVTLGSGLHVTAHGFTGYLWCFDFDGFCDLDDGVPDTDLLEIMGLMDGYLEVSPSGTGAKAFFVSDKPPATKLKVHFAPSKLADQYPDIRKYREREIEVFSKNVFLTLTGDRLFDGEYFELYNIGSKELDRLIDRIDEVAKKGGGLGRDKRPKEKTSSSSNAEKVNGYGKLTQTSLKLVLDHVDADDESCWSDTANALARVYGEEGRKWFHDYSKRSNKYNPDKVDPRFDRALSDLKKHPDGFGMKRLIELSGLDTLALSWEEEKIDLVWKDAPEKVMALAQGLIIQSAEDLARVRLMALNSAVHGHPINAFMAKGDGSDAFKDCVEKAYAKAHDVMTVSEVTLGDLPKEVVALKDIQKRFSVLTITKKRPVILDSEKDIITIKDEVKLVLGGRAVLVGFDNAENPIYKDAYPAWEGAKGRRNMTEVVMTRQVTSEHQWNLFPGFGVRPEAGCCDRILQHIHEVICSKDDVAYEAMMNLIAWQFQNIGTPSRIIVGLRSSQQQVGKNMFMDHILGRCLKHAYFYSNDANRVFGQFNAQMRGVVVLCLDEAVFAKDRSLAAKIKSSVQAHQLPSEDKYIATVMLPSGLNLWILTNEDHMAHLDPHDARHWLLDVSEHRKGDDSYFESLMGEIENGGVEAFLDLMISRDIRGFLPQRDTPRDTAAGNRAKALSIGELATQQWLLECVESGYMFGLDDAGGGMLQKPEGDFLKISSEWPGDFEIQMKAGVLYQSYKRWCAVTKSYGRSPDPTGTFWKILTALGFNQVRSNQARLREVPPLQSLEKDLDDLIAGRISVGP